MPHRPSNSVEGTAGITMCLKAGLLISTFLLGLVLTACDDAGSAGEPEPATSGASSTSPPTDTPVPSFGGESTPDSSMQSKPALETEEPGKASADTPAPASPALPTAAQATEGPGQAAPATPTPAPSAAQATERPGQAATATPTPASPALPTAAPAVEGPGQAAPATPTPVPPSPAPTATPTTQSTPTPSRKVGGGSWPGSPGLHGHHGGRRSAGPLQFPGQQALHPLFLCHLVTPLPRRVADAA